MMLKNFCWQPTSRRTLGNRMFCESMKRPRRVLFNVPGSDIKKITKATTLDLDCVVLDFEDGVALSEKQKAREIIPEALFRNNFGRAERCVRINPQESGFQEDDIRALVPVISKLDVIVIPKVAYAHHIINIHQFLKKFDPQHRIKLFAGIESARGLLNLKEISEAPRIEALIFASEDYCADVGITRTKHGEEFLYARSTVVTYAAAYRLNSFDMVCIDYKDDEQLKRECKQGYNLGYTGKQAIHPEQIQTIYDEFCPPPDKIDFAKRIIEESEKHQAHGKGAFELDGKMIDMPLVLQAKNTLSKANLK